jgi:hypothetical protein
MTAFTLRRIGSRVMVLPVQTPETVDIVYLADLDPAGLVQDDDETFWAMTPDSGAPGTPLKRVSASQLADYVNGRLGGIPGTGTVSSISASGGIGAMPNPITTVGSIFLPNTGVVAGTYANATFTVDLQGRIVRAVPGGAAAVWDGGSTTWDAATSTWDAGSGTTVSAGFFHLTPMAAPATPASGSVIYADSGNGDRVTIKNAAGAMIVIGP